MWCACRSGGSGGCGCGGCTLGGGVRVGYMHWLLLITPSQRRIFNSCNLILGVFLLKSRKYVIQKNAWVGDVHWHYTSTLS